MASAAPSGYIVPLPRIPKVIGILNIVFAAGLLACGICSGIYAAFMPAMMRGMTQSMKQMEEKQKSEVKDALKAMEDEEAAAKTDEERTEIEAKNATKKRELQESLKRPLLFPTMDMEKMGMNDPKLMGWWWLEVVSGFALNVMLLVSGIALVRFKRSGITMGLSCAGLKILRLVLLWGFFVFAIVPGMSQKLGNAVGEMFEQQQAMAPGRKGGPPPREFMIRTYTIMYSSMGIAMIVVGSIYPGVCLVLLSRPGARAACEAKKQLEDRGEAW